ncbi:MAG: acyl-CoA desaturase [Candidatus Eisenbacteria bacterium]
MTSAAQAPAAHPRQGLKFEGHTEFQTELRRRIDEFFRQSGRRQRDCPEMYLKTAILMTSLVGLYVLLVFFASTWWQALPLAMLLGLNTAAIGFNVQHDGGHHAYSDRPWVNKLAALAMDLIGASSYVWSWKHGVLHHTYTNLTGLDSDIDFGVFGRGTPHQPLRRYHRWQHWYLWPLYGLMIARWELWADFADAAQGRIGNYRIPRPSGTHLAIFLGGKVVFFGLCFGLPMLHHSVWAVLGCYVVFALVLGLVLSVVFQLAHCVEEAAFPMPNPQTGNIEAAWAIHQVQTTVDFSRRSRVASWLLGGLNYQIEHHLFPRICHVNYPAMSAIVESTCREYGIRYNVHPSFLAGVASHYRWLRRMGREAA